MNSDPVVTIENGTLTVSHQGRTHSVPLPTPPAVEGQPQAVLDPAMLSMIIQLVLQILAGFGIFKPAA